MMGGGREWSGPGGCDQLVEVTPWLGVGYDDAVIGQYCGYGCSIQTLQSN
jgi:hypothetical protein